MDNQSESKLLGETKVLGESRLLGETKVLGESKILGELNCLTVNGILARSIPLNPDYDKAAPKKPTLESEVDFKFNPKSVDS